MSNGLVGVNLVDLRKFGKGNYKQLDDYAFGSGGMLFAAPQLKEALEFAINTHSVDPSGNKLPPSLTRDGVAGAKVSHLEGRCLEQTERCNNTKPFVIFPSPQGVLISQEIIESLAAQEHVIIFCGHYEGIDERFIEKYVDLEISIGDCVLTGGEIPAMLIVDSMSRLVPGVVGKNKAVIEDSFYRGMLDNPNFTRPFSWEGLEVPEVLLSGNEKEISKWRRREAVKRTLTRRPDLISRASIREYLSEGVGIAVIVDDENFNLSGISELCRAYDLGRVFVVARSHELREKIKNLYPEAKLIGNIEKLSENYSLIVKVFSEVQKNSLHSLEIKRRCLEHEGKILFVFSENESRLEEINIQGLSSYIYSENIKVPLNVFIGITLDRFLGKR